ncbi:hypothetical protein [Bacillus pseudomycoides]|uniref:hypothetical protein n=1 Tax=Bacillus pseudomycoides TaxID=64104 RepID=UPI0014836504|nr:hypothetical protein [Bacillus pseudomycoides]
MDEIKVGVFLNGECLYEFTNGEDELLDVYEEARFMTEETGQFHEVKMIND